MGSHVHPPAAIRTVDLPDGRRLVVRPVTPVDVGALSELYDSLDDGARYRRFFSAFRPRPRFFHRLVRAEERGGAELVAEERDPGGAERLVGEAGYELLPNGNGELAIVVDDAWRGWLGPFLLDALLEVAAARGVPNLEADILATNGPMLALARARGYAVLPRDDWAVSRIVIGAADRQAGWPPQRHGPRVLVEGPQGHWHAEAAATAAGLEVLACSGPDARRRPCPLLAGQPCPLVEGADVIVVSHAPGTEAWDELRAHHSRHAGVPVCVERLHRRDGVGPGEVALPDTAEDAVVQLVAARAASGQQG